MADLREQSLEDQFAEDQLQRHPILARLISSKEVKDLGERAAPPEDGIGPLVAIVTLLQLSQEAAPFQRSTLTDPSRLFEAAVYILSRQLFRNDEAEARAYFKYLRTDADVTTTTGDELVARIAAAAGADELDTDSLLAERLQFWRRSEELAGFAGVRKTAELLCFCCAVWCMEASRSPQAADFALDSKYGGRIGSDAIGLFFKARALLVSPVSSVAQNQIGLEFISAALLRFSENAGMHHTKALYLMRLAGSVAEEATSQDLVNQARTCVDAALGYDPEFATFYATRARVRYKQGDRLGAAVDLQSAIELARYGEESERVRKDYEAWANLLSDWELL